MIFPRNKRETAPVEKTAVDFYDRTVMVLFEARQERSKTALALAKIRMDSKRYRALSQERQDFLYDLYKQAARACGMGAP